MRRRTDDGNPNEVLRQLCGGLTLMTAMLGPCALATPPAAPVRDPVGPESRVRDADGPVMAALELADADPASLKTAAAQAGPLPLLDATADAPPPAFASGDVWSPSLPLVREYPATFSSLPDLRSRAYLMDLSLPTMGGDGHGIRDQSPTEQFIRQVKKEGMPFARLWQNDQALVSLGLNRKGKPGLWIIQKTR